MCLPNSAHPEAPYAVSHLHPKSFSRPIPVHRGIGPVIIIIVPTAMPCAQHGGQTATIPPGRTRVTITPAVIVCAQHGGQTVTVQLEYQWIMTVGICAK